MAGLGIANLPDYVVVPALEQGLLVEVLPELRPMGRAVHMVYPNRKHLPTKVRLLIEFMLRKTAEFSTPG